MESKRRRLNVHGAADGGDDDEEEFLADLGGDDSGDEDANAGGNEQDVQMASNVAMNTPQINKFRSLSLGENQNVLNAVAEGTDDGEEDVVPKKAAVTKSKRRFVSDSDSDSD